MDIRKCFSQKYTLEPTFYNTVLKYTPYGQDEWSSELMNVAGMLVLRAQSASSTGTVKVLINRKCDNKLTISKKEKAFNGSENIFKVFV